MTKTNKYLLIGAIVLIITMSSNSVYASLATFLKKYEEDNKAALTAYNDGYNTWTIGWGSIYNYDQNRPVQEGDTIDQATADRWLQIEAKSKMDAVKQLVKVKINNNQLISLASFAYNEGINALKTQSFLDALYHHDLDELASVFRKYVYADGKILQGLVNRREKEIEYFM